MNDAEAKLLSMSESDVRGIEPGKLLDDLVDALWPIPPNRTPTFVQRRGFGVDGNLMVEMLGWMELEDRPSIDPLESDDGDNWMATDGRTDGVSMYASTLPLAVARYWLLTKWRELQTKHSEAHA